MLRKSGGFIAGGIGMVIGTVAFIACVLLVEVGGITYRKEVTVHASATVPRLVRQRVTGRYQATRGDTGAGQKDQERRNERTRPH